MMEAVGASWHPCEKEGTIIHVAIDGVYAGHIVISDVIKVNAARAIEALHQNGIKRTVMLTGDAKKVAEHVAAALSLDEAYGELLPQDKVAKVEELLRQRKGGKLAFVGDGINDAPVLSRADVGIAMGAMGSDAAIEAADVVLMDDDPLKIAVAQRIARKTMRIVYENIVFSIGVKAVVLVLGAIGLANMWAAIFADVGVMVLAVLNAMRALFASGKVPELPAATGAREEVLPSGAEVETIPVPEPHVERNPAPAAETLPQRSYRIEVDCANCANLMEQAANKVDGVKYATINFMMQEMKVEFERDADQQSVMEQVRAVCKKIEDDCEVYI